MDALGLEIKKTFKDNRVSTGLDGLDGLLMGGFPKGSVILVSGTPGTGKTIICFQYIGVGLKKGERCLYMTSDERINNLVDQATVLGFDFKPYIEQGKLKFLYLDLERRDIHKEMDDEIRTGGYSRVVLDSLTPLSEVPVWLANKGNEIIPSSVSTDRTTFPIDSIQATRTHVRRIMNILEGDLCTTLITSEIPEGARSLSRDSISEFLVDGILLLDLDTTMDRRKLTIRKMRGTRHTLKPQNITIQDGGISII